MTGVIQGSFGKGEIAPALYGRVDTSIYKIALRKARNCRINVTGGVSNRSGTIFIGPVKTHADLPSLLRFQFKTSDTYALEFGDAYMRVVKNDGHVLESTFNISDATQANPVVVTTAAHSYSNGDEVFITGVSGMTEINDQRFVIANKTGTTFELTDQVTGANIDGTAFTAYSADGTAARVFTLTTPYALADVRTIKYTQSADVMTLTHPTYDPQELSRTGDAAWTISDASFAPTIADPTAVAVSVGGADNNIFWKYIVTAIAEETLEESLAGVSNAGLTVVSTDNTNPVSVEITTHGLLTGDRVEFSGLTEMTELNGRRFAVTKTDANNFTLQGEDGTSYTDEATGGANTCRAAFVGTGTAAAPTGTTIPNNTVTWAAVAGAVKYAIYRAKGGSGTFGLLAETAELTFTDSETALQETDLTVGPPTARNPFFGSDNKPGAVSYYEQRRVFGGTNNRPDTQFYSRPAAHGNMSISDPGQADDAITTTLNSLQVNEIRHFVPGNDLLVFTSGSEWLVNSGPDSGFSADTLNQKPQSYFGSSHRIPIPIGPTVMFVTESNKQIRSFGFSFEFDGYSGSNMTQLASHLFETYTIEDWAFARDPHSVIYVVRGDGQLATMTFSREQETIAWSTWDTKGTYERTVAMRPAATDTFDAPFFIVKRKINGNTVRYIERAHENQFTEPEDAFYVDSGKSLDSPIAISGATAADPVVITTTAVHGLSTGDEVDIEGITWTSTFDTKGNETQPDQLNGKRFTITVLTTTTFSLQNSSAVDIDGSAFDAYVEGGNVRLAVTTLSGLRHIIGEEAAVLADGNVVSGLTVSATGTITLARKASRVHVGLSYISDVETLDIEVPEAGTIQNKKIKVSSVTVRYERSRGILIGPDADSLIEEKERQFESYDEPTRLLTGERETTIASNWNSNGRLFMRQKDPIPMNILSVTPDVEVGDNGE